MEGLCQYLSPLVFLVPCALTLGSLQPAMMNDGVLEVVSISGVLHMGSIQAHLAKAKKIAQGSRVEIEAREPGTAESGSFPLPLSLSQVTCK